MANGKRAKQKQPHYEMVAQEKVTTLPDPLSYVGPEKKAHLFDPYLGWGAEKYILTDEDWWGNFPDSEGNRTLAHVHIKRLFFFNYKNNKPDSIKAFVWRVMVAGTDDLAMWRDFAENEFEAACQVYNTIDHGTTKANLETMGFDYY